MDAMEKRKRVMARSIRLGHCVCDPRKPCPCPLFNEKNICTCAGETLPAPGTGTPVRLTDHVRNAGCASKIGQKELHAILERLPPVKDPRLLVGMATADDAAVFRIAPGLNLVQTVDVFTPVVDDPFLFGRIAACNSLSDVYAMGGTPVTALSIIGFPIESLPPGAMADILRGGIEALAEAGAVLVGGHSINDEEVKFGFAVTGVVPEAAIVTNAGAQPGDVLILTKPLGTGIVALAERLGKADAVSGRAAAASMGALNKAAAEVMARRRATACTDVTGFGFIGHLSRIAIESAVTAEIWFDRLPLLPGVMNYAAQGIYSGAKERNAEYSAQRTRMESGVTDEMQAVLFDAQTSGGLLMALPAGEAEAALGDLHAAGVASAAIVGRIIEKSEGLIRIKPAAPAGDNRCRAVKSEQENKMENNKKDAAEACCVHGAASAEGALARFQEFMASSLAPGKLDVVTKELLAIALGLAVNCVPCSRIHISKAKKMGISPEEMEEAAALAVAFAGCRALMLWNDLKKELL